MNRLRNLSSKAKIVIVLLFIVIAVGAAALIVYAIQQNQAPTDSSATNNAGQRDFSKRFSANAKGDIALIGNVVVTCKSNSSSCSSSQNGSNSNDNNNYSGDMQYVDVDSDSSTFDSSSATLNLPANSTVLWAGLYWGGRTQSVNSAAGQVKLKAPNASAYTDLTTAHTDGDSRFYGNFADVTNIVKAANNGTYTIANVKADPTWDVSGGVSAGWALIVAYKDPAQTTMRNLTVFDGFKDYEKETKTFTLSGFLTPPTGPIKASMGVVAWDGDKGIDGDSLTVGSTKLSNNKNPSTNVFNSTISSYNSTQGVRNPSYTNNLGFDIDLFDASSIITPNSTSAKFNVNITDNEFIALNAVTTVVDIYSPDLDIQKTVSDINGGSLAPGDTLEYTATITNTGAIDAKTVTISDTIPEHTTYVPGSLQIAGAKTDETGDDTAQFDSNTTKFFLGTGATATAGGTLAPNATATVKFRVTVNSDTPTSTTITNTAHYDATDQYGGTYTGDSTAVTINVSGTPASLTVTKTVTNVSSSGDGSTATPGDILEYGFTVTNTGEQPATNVSITDTIPSLTSYNASSLTIASGANSGTKTDTASDDQAEYTTTGNQITFRLGSGASSSTGGTLAKNESTTFKFRIKIDGTAAHNSSIANKGIVSYNGTTKDSNTVTTVVKTSAPQFDVTKSVTDVNGGEVRPGDILEYSLTIKNNGQQTATNVVLGDVIPSHSTYANNSLNITAGTNSGTKTDATGDDQGEYISGSKQVKFYLGTGATSSAGGSLASGASSSIKFRVTVDNGVANNTTITNVGTVTYKDADNTTQTEDSNPVSVVVKSTVPQLDATKTANDLNGGNLSGGDVIEYTITLNNKTSENALVVVLRDVIDSNTTFVPGSLIIVQGNGTGSKTDTTGDDQGAYNSSTKEVIFYLGAGANATTGGTIAAGEINIVKFRVTLNSGLGGGIHVANKATINYEDESNNELETDSNTTDLVTETVNVSLPDTALDDHQTIVVLLGLSLIMVGAIALRFRLFDNLMAIAGVSIPTMSQRKHHKKRKSFEERVTDKD